MIVHFRVQQQKGFSMNSVKTKILETLKAGNEVSGAQFASRYKTTAVSVAARVSELRREGYPIYNNRRVDSQGRVTFKYRLGTPSKAVIAAGYAAGAR